MSGKKRSEERWSAREEIERGRSFPSWTCSPVEAISSSPTRIGISGAGARWWTKSEGRGVRWLTAWSRRHLKDWPWRGLTHDGVVVDFRGAGVGDGVDTAKAGTGVRRGSTGIGVRSLSVLSSTGTVAIGRLCLLVKLVYDGGGDDDAGVGNDGSGSVAGVDVGKNIRVRVFFIFLVVVSSVAVRVGWQGVGRARGGQRPVWICGDDDDRWSWLWRLDRKRD
ncbi:putative peroxidase 18 [Iris pallida]|uniref:Peroxidase 18 n=1 Tax=Iris pallida TaxID=29817 RepID=A0AAX6DRX6_IRIPA|nr:putative peroxidase 18 [Iris pallida]